MKNPLKSSHIYASVHKVNVIKNDGLDPTIIFAETVLKTVYHSQRYLPFLYLNVYLFCWLHCTDFIIVSARIIVNTINTMN